MNSFTICSNSNFDIDLQVAKGEEICLAHTFTDHRLRIEHKAEKRYWWATGNIAIEYRSYGKRSGIAATKADLWVHELYLPGYGLFGRLLFEVPVLYRLALNAKRRGYVRENIGDDNATCVALLPLGDLSEFWE